jgi:serine O-acetyltransferase
MFTHFIEDWHCYKSPYMTQGFWALQIHRFGMRARAQRWVLIRIPLKIIQILLLKVSEVLFGISIGVNVKIGRRFIIEHFGGIVIHAQAIIGDDVRIRQGVTIGNKTVDRPLDAPVIGNRVNIGAGAKILGKIVIGDDVDIGANAVVLKDVPSHSIAVGVPARIVPKTRKVEAESNSDDGR